jgi:hypothetical protein
MTIFGFNSNVQRGDVTYHVESQARQSDLLLQTMIFVKGQSVGKHAFSYAAMTLDPGFSEEATHNLLKAQHKNVVDSLQHGEIERVLVSSGDIEDVGGAGLSLKWLNPGDAALDHNIVLNFLVLDSGQPCPHAEVSVRAHPGADGGVVAQAVTDAAGVAAISVPADKVEEAVMVQARRAGKSATRKLRLRK